MSDTQVMQALIELHAYGYMASQGLHVQVTADSAKVTADALYAAGFRLATDDINAKQNERLETLEDRIGRLEGWAGIPPWWKESELATAVQAKR